MAKSYADIEKQIAALKAKAEALKAKEVIVAMDACFSGAGGRSVLAKGARPLVMQVDPARPATKASKVPSHPYSSA